MTAGRGFAFLFRGIKVLRPERPIHPEGVSLTGSVERLPPTRRSGISWLDTSGVVQVQARLSRSIGLPGPLPDIVGLALRIPADPGPFDVLLASTGMAGASRFILTPHRFASEAAFTTLMPYQSSRGPVLLAARPLDSALRLPAKTEDFRQALGDRVWTLGLYHSALRGPWTRFATMSLSLDRTQQDTDRRFDPLLHPLPGAGIYRWTRTLREPSYTTARKPS
ncbi:hypothetical protein B0G38_003891 [Arthrobacter sp. VKM Ac-2550]|nr:hypothetical protein [Arthrobacter sp. VKM Ac-2550]